MARNKATGKAPTGKPSRTTRGRGAKGVAVAARQNVNNAREDDEIHDWDEVSDDLSPVADLDGMIGKPAANQSGDPMTRRRIEMLREERLLAKALSDGFDL